jgi:hypothetical protein
VSSPASLGFLRLALQHFKCPVGPLRSLRRTCSCADVAILPAVGWCTLLPSRPKRSRIRSTHKHSRANKHRARQSGWPLGVRVHMLSSHQPYSSRCVVNARAYLKNPRDQQATRTGPAHSLTHFAGRLKSACIGVRTSLLTTHAQPAVIQTPTRTYRLLDM